MHAFKELQNCKKAHKGTTSPICPPHPFTYLASRVGQWTPNFNYISSMVTELHVPKITLLQWLGPSPLLTCYTDYSDRTVCVRDRNLYVRDRTVSVRVMLSDVTYTQHTNCSLWISVVILTLFPSF